MRDFKALFKINQNSRYPLYERIEQNFRELITGSQLLPGESIPSEWELSEIYGVSRLTVRHALEELARQGWLNRRHGVGTFVTTPNTTQIHASHLSFSDQMTAIGRTPSSRLIGARLTPANEEIARQLSIRPSEPVVEITRVRLADNAPILLEVSHLSSARFPGLENAGALAQDSLYLHLSQRYQVNITDIDQAFQPVLLPEAEARLLDAPAGSPAIMSEIIAYSKGDPIEYCWSVTRGDQCKFYLHFHRRESVEKC